LCLRNEASPLGDVIAPHEAFEFFGARELRTERLAGFRGFRVREEPDHAARLTVGPDQASIAWVDLAAKIARAARDRTKQARHLGGFPPPLREDFIRQHGFFRPDGLDNDVRR